MNGEGEKYMTIEKVMELLKKDGIIVSVDQAKLMADFLTMIADLTIESYLKIN